MKKNNKKDKSYYYIQEISGPFQVYIKKHLINSIWAFHSSAQTDDY